MSQDLDGEQNLDEEAFHLILNTGVKALVAQLRQFIPDSVSRHPWPTPLFWQPLTKGN